MIDVPGPSHAFLPPSPEEINWGDEIFADSESHNALSIHTGDDPNAFQFPSFLASSTIGQTHSNGAQGFSNFVPQAGGTEARRFGMTVDQMQPAPEPQAHTYTTATAHIGSPPADQPLRQVSLEAITVASPETRDTNFKCTHCPAVFVNSFTLQRHVKENHAASVKLFPCPHPRCTRSTGGSMPAFKRIHHLNRHLEICKHKPKNAGSSTSASQPQALVNSRSQRPQNSQAALAESRKRGSCSVSSGNEQLIDGLRRRHKARAEALEARKREWELEYEREKAKLDRLAASIRDLEEEEQEEDEREDGGEVNKLNGADFD